MDAHVQQYLGDHGASFILRNMHLVSKLENAKNTGKVAAEEKSVMHFANNSGVTSSLPAGRQGTWSEPPFSSVGYLRSLAALSLVASNSEVKSEPRWTVLA